ncbi:SDR family NAD(P)-dependent oxidoreductase [Micromonospora sp. LOL_021]|uniref:SDR family NAD(P)-dependent oxidoreductase n=1 Tax=Micromonospora sp. LOL_021 TaxID=3345417 RepID=UPI003A8A1A57
MNLEPIAVVGIGCRYPDAVGPDQLWQTVLGRRRAFRLLPTERLGLAYRGDRDDPDTTYVTHAGLLRDWTFDRQRFGIPGPLYRSADHSHWLALETAAEVLADAGLGGGQLDRVGIDRDHVGVVLGNSLTGEFSRSWTVRARLPYLAEASALAMRRAGVPDSQAANALEALGDLVRSTFPEPNDETLAGSLANTIAGRICNYFDFHGTGYTVDGACSSSLLAVMTAARALRDRELDLAIAGGVDLSLDPLELVGFARIGALSVDEMRVYDAEPTGFLPGEGCGMVALMRVDDAERLGLRSYAYISGWGTSSDGSGGLTRPVMSGQAMALRRAYRMAGVSPDQVGLVEGHGTGTSVGDRVELEALWQVLAGSDRRGPAALGSVKANIGHTKAAAGVASLIKAVLAVHHRVQPPTTGCPQPHGLLRRAGAPVETRHEVREWAEKVPVAGVSSMGFGGINSHLVVTGATPGGHRVGALPATISAWARPVPDDDIIELRAADQASLIGQLRILADQAARLSYAELHDLAASCNRAGGRGAFRAALVASRPSAIAAATSRAVELLSCLDGAIAFDESAGAAVGFGTARLGLLCPGQAAPVRADLPSWAVELGVPEPDYEFAVRDGDVATDAAQPAIVRQSLAGLAWLSALGCQPSAAVGHSLGEITALVWAGALDPADALRLASTRGQVMAAYGAADTGMAQLAADAATVTGLLAGTNLVVAGFNGLRQTTVAGSLVELRRMLSRAAADGIIGKLLPVSHGFHSPAMAAAQEPFREALKGISLGSVARPVFSTTTGELLTRGTDLAQLLVDQLTTPVQFLPAVQGLAARCDLLVEVGPGTILSGLTAGCDVGTPVVSLDCLGPPRRHAWATAVLAAGGADLDAYFAGRAYRQVGLGEPITLLENQCEALPVDEPRPAQPLAVATDAVAAVTSAEPVLIGVTRAGSRANGRPANGSATDWLPANGSATDGSATDGSATDWLPADGSAADGHPVVDSAPPEIVGPAQPDRLDTLTVVRQHLADTLELSISEIRPESGLLGDLHLNSLQAVQTFVEIANKLARVPAEPSAELANATVGQVAELIAGLPPAGSPRSVATEGVRAVVRAFQHDWRPYPPGDPLPTSAPTAWQAQAPDGHWLNDVVEQVTVVSAARRGLAIVLSGGADQAIDVTVEAMRLIEQHRPDTLLLVHSGHPAAAAIGRGVAAEQLGCAVTVVDVEDGHRLTRLDLAGVQAYQELRVDAAGALLRLETTALPVRPTDASTHLTETDVLLVSGGVGGITATSAAAIAETAGCGLVVLGRSSPESPQVRDGLRQLTRRVRVWYVQCDITDLEQTRDAVRQAGRYGRVSGVVHGAGVNQPRRITEVTADSLAETTAPKVSGLRNLLAAAGDGMRLVLAYGSIIGRCGLAGQLEYCVANDWMRVELERWAAEHPQCRTHLLEWSVWGARGMGVRLGALESLTARGVAPIDPIDGEAVLLDLLADPDAPVTVLLTSRYPATATLAVPPVASLAALRFAEDRRDLLPSVELVLDSRLSLGTDPYLTDHRIDGAAVFPAVLGLEAMAQSVVALRGSRPAWSMRQVSFAAPILVPDHDVRTLRCAALAGAQDPDEVEVVLRDDQDAFTQVRFSAVVGEVPLPPPSNRLGTPPATAQAVHPFYGSVFFHSGRFARIARYEWLSAFAVRAWLDPGPSVRWFSEYHGEELLLGDPGLLDASIHALLACVPHRRALPVAVARFTAWRPVRGAVQVIAVERSHTVDSYVFDVVLVDPQGLALAQWTGLRLRAVGPSGVDPLPVETVGAYLARRLIEYDIADDVDLWLTPEPADGVDKMVRGLLPGPAVPTRSFPNRWGTMVALSARPVAIATASPADSVPDGWTGSAELVGEIADKTGEPAIAAGITVRVAEAALAELAGSHAGPLRLEQVADAALLVLRCGSTAVLVARVSMPGEKLPVSVAVAVDGS